MGNGQSTPKGEGMHAWRPGFMAFLAAAWIAPAVFAQATSSDPPADFGGERWSTLSPDLDCGQMKERVDAILSSNSTYKDPVTGGGANLNNSGTPGYIGKPPSYPERLQDLSNPSASYPRVTPNSGVIRR